jgi:Sarcosine oxidase A3 domain
VTSEPPNPAMAWDRLEPPSRAGDVARRRPLTVLPLQRRMVDELRVVDDDLPQADGATLLWLERDGDGWVAWAALLRDTEATPWVIAARSVRLVRPDPSLLRWLGTDAAALGSEGNPRPVEPMPRHLSCICREKSAESAYRAAEAGWATVDAVKRRTGAVFGECQGRRCESLIAGWLDLDAGDPQGRITSRPPLVPVPASVLAAFVDA